MTDNFKCAVNAMMNNESEVSYIPVVAVGLGNILLIDNQDFVMHELGVPLAYDSIWVKGVWGHKYYRNL